LAAEVVIGGGGGGDGGAVGEGGVETDLAELLAEADAIVGGSIHGERTIV
jgi:hypothetical protein